jgi:hypothetical protein
MPKATEQGITALVDWAMSAAIEIVADVQRFNRDDAVEIVAGRLRDAHRAGQLQRIPAATEGA